MDGRRLKLKYMQRLFVFSMESIDVQIEFELPLFLKRVASPLWFVVQSYSTVQGGL